jgi:cytochrome c heme-lyase
MGNSQSAPPDAAAAAGCPVDHKTRETWLAQNPSTPSPHATPESKSSQSTPAKVRLSQNRQISSIPRALTDALDTSTHSPSSIPANSEVDTHTSESGHWVYPSEAQFFQALIRKSQPASATDMSSVVPIHNAVNERAWHEILTWEQPRCQTSGCAMGPRLASFRGDSTKRTPKAWMNVLMGYQAPFDRHDWVVERCGTRVEYVIDFYQGKDQPEKGPLSFYLDVRPKLNSWEGVRMRLGKTFGLDG